VCEIQSGCLENGIRFRGLHTVAQRHKKVSNALLALLFVLCKQECFKIVL